MNSMRIYSNGINLKVNIYLIDCNYTKIIDAILIWKKM